MTDAERAAIRERLQESATLQSVCSDGNSDIRRVVDDLVAQIAIALAPFRRRDE